MKKLILLPVFYCILFTARAQYTPFTCNTPMLISTGTLAVSGDDAINAIPLPFTFTFYGTAHNTVYVSTNGFISFDASASDGCCRGYDLPNSASATYIALGHTDLYVPSTTPGTNGSVFYATVGTTPNRKFVIHYMNAYQCCGLTPLVTGEIQLYEAGSEIRIVAGAIAIPANYGTTMGIGKGDNTLSSVVNARNDLSSFTANNECWSLSSMNILPITLSKFSGRMTGANSNLLEWTTASENNSLSFDVQRSTSGTDYTTIQTIQAAGNSAVSRNYSYADDVSQVKAAMYYYRLKMSDIDHVYKYSPIVKINGAKNNLVAESSPNPFTRQFTVNIGSEKPEEAMVMLTDINGRKLLEGKYQLNKGNNAIVLEVPQNIQPGTYLLKINIGYSQQTLKVVKQ